MLASNEQCRKQPAFQKMVEYIIDWEYADWRLIAAVLSVERSLLMNACPSEVRSIVPQLIDLLESFRQHWWFLVSTAAPGLTPPLGGPRYEMEFCKATVRQLVETRVFLSLSAARGSD